MPDAYFAAQPSADEIRARMSGFGGWLEIDLDALSDVAPQTDEGAPQVEGPAASTPAKAKQSPKGAVFITRAFPHITWAPYDPN